MLTSKNLNYSKKVFGIMALVCLSLSSYSGEVIRGNKKIENEKIETILDDDFDEGEYTEIKILGQSNVNAEKLKNIVIEDIREFAEGKGTNAILLHGEDKDSNEGIAKFVAKDLKIEIKQEEDSGFGNIAGVKLNEGADFKVQNLDIDILHSATKLEDETSAGIELIKLNFNDENPAKNSTKFEAENVNIKMANTENSKEDELVGVEIERPEKINTKTYFKVKNDLNIELKDSSKKQNSFLFGLRVEAVDTEVEINNSNIVLEGKSSESAAIFIDDIEGEIEDIKSSSAGILVSKGKMKIDTTKALNALAIEMLGTGGEIRANQEGSSAEIKTVGTAIGFKGYKSALDGDESAEEIEEFKSSIGSNQKVSLKNAVITSTEKNGYKSLIHVDEDVKNAVLNISGAESKLTPGNGNLMHVKNNSNITFNLTDGALAEGVITNWTSGVSRLNVTNNAVWKLSGSYPSSNVTKLVLKDGGTLDATNLTRDGEIASHGIKSYIDETEDTAVINDNGIIRMDNNNYSDELVFYKNYEGKNDAKIKVNTLWNNNTNTSKSDKLVIDGEAKGETRVIAVGIDGKENIIDGDIKRVQKEIQNSPVVVDVKKAAEGTFKGTAKTRGAAEAQLASAINKDGRREFFWTLNALPEVPKDDSNNQNVSPEKPTNPKDDNNMNPEKPINKPEDPKDNSNNENTNPIKPENPTDKPEVPIVKPPVNNNESTGPVIYSSVVPAYASIEKINRDLGFTSLATLNERKGDTRLEKNDKEQAWFRIIGKDADYKGKNRFEADTNLYGAQAGYEFNVGFDKNGNKNIYGAYIAHIEADTKFYDRYRAVNGRISGDKYTGKVKTKDLNLGLTKTKYYTNGMYLDLVGQFSFINNKYQIRDTESKKQKGNAIILSAEIGKKYDVTENWYLEPQAQLAYQYLRLKDFNDGLRDVNYKNEGDFRGRLGLRFATKAKRNATFYTLANIVHDFDDKSEVRIGRDKVNEKYAKTLGEVGLGAEYLFNEATSMFGDFRYERSFKKNPKYDSYRGTFGLKYSW